MTDENNLYYEHCQLTENKLKKVIDNDQNPRIEESEFKLLFLPMFIGGGTYINREAWTVVAGSTTQEVDVVQGTRILYTLPPLDIPIKTDISRRNPNRRGMGDNWAGVGLSAGQDPGGADAVMGINNKLADVHLAYTQAEHLARWNAVFERYDLDVDQIRAEVYGVPVSETSKRTKQKVEELHFEANKPNENY